MTSDGLPPISLSRVIASINYPSRLQSSPPKCLQRTVVDGNTLATDNDMFYRYLVG